MTKEVDKITKTPLLPMNLQLFAQPSGGDGGGSEEPESGTETNNEGEEKQETKTFTQDEVDKLIKDKLSDSKKNLPSKEELEAYKQWKESQKTESEKKDEALTNAEKAKQSAEERALLAETKVTCLSKGVNATAVDDVVVLAKAMVSDDVTIDQAIDKVLEKYPHFKEQETEEKGFKKVGSSGNKEKQTTDEALKAAFGIK
jgi:hypothetical protein